MFHVIMTKLHVNICYLPSALEISSASPVPWGNMEICPKVRQYRNIYVAKRTGFLIQLAVLHFHFVKTSKGLIKKTFLLKWIQTPCLSLYMGHGQEKVNILFYRMRTSVFIPEGTKIMSIFFFKHIACMWLSTQVLEVFLISCTITMGGMCENLTKESIAVNTG